MNLTFEDIKKSGNYSHTVKFDFSDEDINDVLLKKVNSAQVKLEAYIISNDEAYISFDVKYNIDYLDAGDLEMLNLDFEFNDEAIFTTDLEKAEQLDLEYVPDGEINIKELVFNLVVVDVPLNYTRSSIYEHADVEENDETNLYSPFADIFNNKEE